GCFATDEDVTARLPQLLAAPPLAILPGVASLDAVQEAFVQTLGANGFSSAKVQWSVVPKRPVAVAPAAATPPAANR
ncbi:MAG TPA: peptidoglycan-binding protein, partial [Polaromonas sp.]|nr:peptidoglycan-binding protein [Polaromonas sp.]HQS92958.1 peptidoglycan-binding protein [Polaromonas sp.]